MATAEVWGHVNHMEAQPHHDKDGSETITTEASKRPVDPAKLKEKYLEERDRRINTGRDAFQYRLVEHDGPFAKYLQDPWADPNFTRDPVTEEVDVAIIGGGYGGQMLAVKLIEAGVPTERIRIIEKAADFGGTWYWNRFPGAQCDIESYIYMPLLEETNYVPSEKYAHGEELQEHSRRIGRHFGLYDLALFQTVAHKMQWDEEGGLWSISTSRNDGIRARFVLPCTGPLHRPKLPGVPGMEAFKGHHFHSNNWDYSYTGGDRNGNLTKLEDKRVALLGTGATAVSIVPMVAEYAKQLHVVQRTPSAINVRGNRPTDPTWANSLGKGWQKERMDNFAAVMNKQRPESDLVDDALTELFTRLAGNPSEQAQDPEKAMQQSQAADYAFMEEIRARCDTVVKDTATAQSLKPWYNALCKRPCFHDDYLAAFNRPNVRLVDTHGLGVERITENGIMVNGEELEVDLIVYATGFEMFTPMERRSGLKIIGKGGKTLSEAWKYGYRTFQGQNTRGFPNCGWVTIYQAFVTPNFTAVIMAMAERHAYVIKKCLESGVRAIEPTEEAEQQWVDDIIKASNQVAPFFMECTPGYLNHEGKNVKGGAQQGAIGPAPVWTGIVDKWIEEDKLDGMELRYFGN